MNRKGMTLFSGLIVMAGLSAGCGGNGPRPTGAVPIIRAVKHVRDHNRQAKEPAADQKVPPEPAPSVD